MQYCLSCATMSLRNAFCPSARVHKQNISLHNNNNPTIKPSECHHKMLICILHTCAGAVLCGFWLCFLCLCIQELYSKYQNTTNGWWCVRFTVRSTTKTTRWIAARQIYYKFIAEDRKWSQERIQPSHQRHTSFGAAHCVGHLTVRFRSDLFCVYHF